MTDPQTTAYPEARHAVVATVRGVPVSYVTLDGEHGPAKTVVEVDDTKPEWLDMLVAGAVAESLCLEKPISRHVEYRRAERTAHRQTNCPATARYRMFRARRKAEEILRRHWGAVQQVADALLVYECLTGADVIVMIETQRHFREG